MEEYDARNLLELYGNPNTIDSFLTILQKSKGSRLVNIFLEHFPIQRVSMNSRHVPRLVHILCFKATNGKKLEEVVLKILGNLRSGLYVPSILERIKDKHSFEVFVKIIMTKPNRYDDLHTIIRIVVESYDTHDGLKFLFENFTAPGVEDRALDILLKILRTNFASNKIQKEIPIVLNELNLSKEKKDKILTALNS
jgi:hypothetical protein